MQAVSLVQQYRQAEAADWTAVKGEKCLIQ
jgi:hypothetical protein